jgi:hypothetical protein
MPTNAAVVTRASTCRTEQSPSQPADRRNATIVRRPSQNLRSADQEVGRKISVRCERGVDRRA